MMAGIMCYETMNLSSDEGDSTGSSSRDASDISDEKRADMPAHFSSSSDTQERTPTSSIQHAGYDHVIYDDKRVLCNLLASENNHQIGNGFKRYVDGRQEEVLNMRLMEVDNMLQIYYLGGIEYQALSLSVRLMDQFLSVCEIKSDRELQIVGATCVLVASKLRQHGVLTVENIVHFAGSCITKQEILDQEFSLLAELNYNINLVTASDFIQPILSRLTWAQECPLRDVVNAFNRCHFVEHELITKRPSVVASGCFMAAARVLDIPSHSAEQICLVTKVNQEAAMEVAQILQPYDTILRQELKLK